MLQEKTGKKADAQRKSKETQIKNSRNDFLRKFLYYDPDEKRKCSLCNEEKTNNDFYKTISFTNRGHRNFRIRKECKQCIIDIRKKNWHENYHQKRKESRDAYRRKHRYKNIKTQYGITKEEYLKMIKDTKLCPICNKEIIKPNIDHCHDSGKIRGILCFKCNVGLGSFNDNINSLKNAIKYLNKNRGIGEKPIKKEK